MYSFIVRKDRKNKDGLYDIQLRVVKGGKRKRIALKLATNLDYWDEQQERFIILKGLRSTSEKEANEKRKKNNDLLERYNQRVLKVIEQLESTGLDWTLNQFKDTFLSKVKQGNLYIYTTAHIQVLRSTGHIGNAICYERLLHMLSIFDKDIKERVFSEVDIKYVKRFDVFLQKRGNKGNTRMVNFKTLRAILNKAIQDGEASSTTYPFGKRGFQISQLEEVTQKRYLPNEYLDLLKNSCSLKPNNEYARNLFLFSYYCYGISFVDMAHLTRKNIKTLEEGRYIVYKREKTKNQPKSKDLKIKITVEIKEAINALIAFKEPIGDYLLPIVTVQHSGEALYIHIRNRTKRYNAYLRSLGKELAFEFNLTSYVSRHTMAMQLQNNSTAREVISQMLGHQNMQVTNTYLDSIDSSVIDEAAKVL